VSIHHEVSVHCDGCGHWQHGNDSTTRQRRSDGWSIWRTGGTCGHWRHLCPTCTAGGKRTHDGLAANEVIPDDD
jgi:hypothetical protein